MRLRRTILLTAWLLALCQTAWTEELPDRPLTAEIAVADATAIGLGIATMFAQPADTSQASRIGRGFGMMGGVGAVAAPSIYWANRREGLGAGSLMIRTMTPLATMVFGLAGTCVAREGDRGCVTDGMIGGTAFGVVAASAFDILVLSRAPRARRLPDKIWYGWQLLIIDATTAAIGGAIALRASASGPVFTADPDTGVLNFALSEWIPMWLLGTISAPIVHFVHGQLLKGLASGALRFGGSALASVGGLMGYCAAVGGEPGCTGVGISWGLIGGALFVASVDAFIIARKPVEAEPSTTWMIAPTVITDSPGLSVLGRF